MRYRRYSKWRRFNKPKVRHPDDEELPQRSATNSL